jgi:Na+-transporting NADH:ubiquinone oxidoreductase subunit NqrC
LLLVASLLIATAAFGQRGFDVNQRVQMLKERLKLSDEQTAKVMEIMNGSMKEMQALREKSGEDREAMRAGMREIQQKNDKKIEPLLNDDQKKEFAKLREEQRKRMEERMHGGPGGPGGPPEGNKPPEPKP